MIGALLLCCATATNMNAQDRPQPTPSGEQRSPLQVGGAFPELAVVGVHIDRSEMGIGALLPWADRLWMISYVAHIRGSGGGLYELDEKMQMRKHPQSVTGTFANRMVHNPRTKRLSARTSLISKDRSEPFRRCRSCA